MIKTRLCLSRILCISLLCVGGIVVGEGHEASATLQKRNSIMPLSNFFRMNSRTRSSIASNTSTVMGAEGSLSSYGGKGFRMSNTSSINGSRVPSIEFGNSVRSGGATSLPEFIIEDLDASPAPSPAMRRGVVYSTANLGRFDSMGSLDSVSNDESISSSLKVPKVSLNPKASRVVMPSLGEDSSIARIFRSGGDDYEVINDFVKGFDGEVNTTPIEKVYKVREKDVSMDLSTDLDGKVSSILILDGDEKPLLNRVYENKKWILNGKIYDISNIFS